MATPKWSLGNDSLTTTYATLKLPTKLEQKRTHLMSSYTRLNSNKLINSYKIHKYT